MIDESGDAPQIEAALLFEYEMMRIETYSRQPDPMSHANDFRVGDRFQRPGRLPHLRNRN
jgi:hypothetical protein